MPLGQIQGFRFGDWEKTIPRRCRIDRDETVLGLSSGKKVLHVGAVDAPFHQEKAIRGELLHQKLQSVAANVVGIDWDAEAVQWLRDEFGIEDIVIGDATDSADPIGDGAIFDVIVCCDVIEHVTNVHALLSLCRRHMDSHSVLVVTTVNATAIKPAIRALLGREAVHHDHVAYFSYGTLCQLLAKCGFAPSQFGAYGYPMSLRILDPAFKGLMAIAPGVADGILVTARLGIFDEGRH